MKFHVEPCDQDPQADEWFIYMTATNGETTVEYEYCNTYATQLEAYRIKRTLESLEVINLDDWIETDDSVFQGAR